MRSSGIKGGRMGGASHLHDAVLAVKVRELILNLARLSLHDKENMGWAWGCRWWGCLVSREARCKTHDDSVIHSPETRVNG